MKNYGFLNGQGINANRAAQNNAQAQISVAEAEIAVVWEDLQNTTVTTLIAQECGQNCVRHFTHIT